MDDSDDESSKTSSSNDSNEERFKPTRSARSSTSTPAPVPVRKSQRSVSLAESTAYLAPSTPPELAPDGKYIKPSGRAPVPGYTWNATRGVWVPGHTLMQQTADQISQQEIRWRGAQGRTSKRNRNPSFSSKDGTKKRRSDQDSGGDNDDEYFMEDVTSSVASKQVTNKGNESEAETLETDEKEDRKPAARKAKDARRPKDARKPKPSARTLARERSRSRNRSSKKSPGKSEDDYSYNGTVLKLPHLPRKAFERPPQMRGPGGRFIKTKIARKTATIPPPVRKTVNVNQKSNFDSSHLDGSGRSFRDDNSSIAPEEEEEEEEEEATPKKEDKKENKKEYPILEEPAEQKEIYHPYSSWKEPIPEDGESELTLYERHRRPRVPPSGTLQCSASALRQELRCVICLDYITNTRIVRECLHRFCEQCIERSLSLVGRRNECPICRVFIPSRRSLAPDPGFDSLIQILRKTLTDDGIKSPTKHLQQAIHHKRKSEKSASDAAAAAAASKEFVNGGDYDVENDDDDNMSVDSTLSRENALSGQLNNFNHITAEDETVSKLVKIELRMSEKESDLEPLKKPFITICGDATVQVLKHFLVQKLGLMGMARFTMWVGCKGRRELLVDATKLTVVVSQLSDEQNGLYTPLYYCRKRQYRLIGHT